MGSGQILQFAPGDRSTGTVFASGLNADAGLAFDPNGNLYEADSDYPNYGNGVIYKFTPDGTKSVFASGLGDPVGLAIDVSGNVYVGDPGPNDLSIYKFTPGGAKSTFASGVYPIGLAFDGSGNLYEADSGYADNSTVGRIYKFMPDGSKSTFASGLAFDGSGNLYAADTAAILKFTPGGLETTFAAGLPDVAFLAFDGSGNLFAADQTGVIHEFTPGGVETTFASGLSNPIGLAFSTQTLTVVGSGVWGPGAPITTWTAPNSTWSFSVQISLAPLPSASCSGGPFGPAGADAFDVYFSNFQYSLNGSAVSTCPSYIGYYDAADGGGLILDDFEGGNNGFVLAQGTQLFAGSTSSPTLLTGTFSAQNSQFDPGVGSIAVESGTISISPGSPLQFLPVAPCRIMDTRNVDGPFGGPYIAGGTSRTIPILSSGCGIPSTASAYSLNFTVVPRAGTLGYLSVWPTGQPQPLVSTLNSLDGSVIANAAIVPAGTAGAINAYATNDTDLVVDINGYFTPPATDTLQFYPLPPCRVLDTRNPAGTFGGPSIAGGASRSFPIPSSLCGVPTGAAAYSFNVTVVPQSALGYVTAWPTGQPQPFVSTLNSPDGLVIANAAIVPAGTDGATSFYASNTTDLVVDINGYFAPPANGGLNFYPVTPCRLVDTRNPDGTFGGPTMAGDTTRTFPLSEGSCGLPASPALQAFSLNMTVVPQGPLAYLSTWPTGGTQPFVSTLNALDGQVVANAAIVPSGGSGSISVYVTNTTDVVIDTNGYFGP